MTDDSKHPPKKAPIAGQILPLGDGQKLVLIGERLEDILDVSTWTEVDNTTIPRSPEEEAQARAQLEAWSASVAAGVAKQRAMQLAERVRASFSPAHADRRVLGDTAGLLAEADRAEHQARRAGAGGARLQDLIDEIRRFARTDPDGDPGQLLNAAAATLDGEAPHGR